MFDRIRLSITITAMSILGITPAVALAGGGCSWGQAKAQPAAQHQPGDILTVAGSAGDFTILAKAVEAAGLSGVLAGDGPLTVFAPTDEAFRTSLTPGQIKDLLDPANRKKLVKVLTYHVVSGRVDSHAARKAGSATTLQGQPIYAVGAPGGGLAINRANVVKADIPANNGIIHAIDRVLIPRPSIAELAAGDERFSTLLAAVKAAGLADTLTSQGPFTVLAPTNDAFAALPEGTVAHLLKEENRDQLRSILLYHVTPGFAGSADVRRMDALPTLQGGYAAVYAPSKHPSKLRIDGAKVQAADLEAGNGTIHAIDRVLMPKPSIAQTASGIESFSTLLTAVQAAGLAEVLDTKGPFTVFAPTNEAFAALPAGTVETLLEPANRDKLQQILKLHVVSGMVLSKEITDQPGMIKADSVAGLPLMIRVAGGEVRVNGATVTQADVLAGNGVIHVIDQVILPEPTMGLQHAQ